MTDKTIINSVDVSGCPCIQFNHIFPPICSLKNGKPMTSREEYIEIIKYWLSQSNNDGFNGFTVETEEYELFEKEAIDTLINFR